MTHVMRRGGLKSTRLVGMEKWLKEYPFGGDGEVA